MSEINQTQPRWGSYIETNSWVTSFLSCCLIFLKIYIFVNAIARLLTVQIFKIQDLKVNWGQKFWLLPLSLSKKKPPKQTVKCKHLVKTVYGFSPIDAYSSWFVFYGLLIVVILLYKGSWPADSSMSSSGGGDIAGSEMTMINGWYWRNVPLFSDEQT